MVENLELLAQIDINKEALPYWRNKIAILRETKGKESEALQITRVVRKDAIRLGSHEDVINLFWEEYFIGRHIFMYARDQAKSPMEKAVKAAYGYFLMRRGAREAENYANKHDVESLKPRTHRFSGQLAMISKNYGSAVKHFEQGISLFEAMEDPTQRWNSLEFRGFLAESLILSGKKDEGIELSQETFKLYDEGDGQIMKKEHGINGYYQWAVWKSGCVFKMWNAIIERGIKLEESQKNQLTEMLLLAGELLKFPDGSASKEGLNFEIRKDEFNRIKKDLGIN